MSKLLSYILSPIYYLYFGFLLLFFHLVQWICYNFIGYKAHKKSVDILNFFLISASYIMGASNKVEFETDIPQDVPVIFVSNHQGMYDIPFLIWYLRKWHPKFISKKELGRGIPSISYNLRHGGSILIDRKDREQSIKAIEHLGKYINDNRRSAVIFPEGTRSKDGNPKPFKVQGLKTLCENAPDAYLVPITINNSWKYTRFGKFPIGWGVNFLIKVHKPLKLSDCKIDQLIQIAEETIKSDIL